LNVKFLLLQLLYANAVENADSSDSFPMRWIDG
jgi:hypothetical protein